MNPEKTKNSKCQEKPCHHGGSSIWMQNPEIIFDQIGLNPGETFLDLGCGPGDYAIKAAELVGPGGAIMAVDASPRLINTLTARVSAMGFKNIQAMTADITRPMAIEDRSIDVCFLSTVLHVFKTGPVVERIFKEIMRVLKPEGRLVIIECKKEDLSFGPPLQMRISEDELTAFAVKAGFTLVKYLDLGRNYLAEYRPV